MSEEPPDMEQKKRKFMDYFTATNLTILWFYFDSSTAFLKV